jgi:acyl-coenzyme A thioesterase 13
MNEANIFLETLISYKGQAFKASNSAAGHWLQYTIHDVAKGSIALKMTVQPQHTNPWQQLHGGVYALLMDETLGLAFATASMGAYYTTINLNVEHLYSANINEEIIAYGRIIRHGKKVAYLEGEIKNSKNELICRATSNLINTGKRIFTLDVK